MPLSYGTRSQMKKKTSSESRLSTKHHDDRRHHYLQHLKSHYEYAKKVHDQYVIEANEMEQKLICMKNKLHKSREEMEDAKTELTNTERMYGLVNLCDDMDNIDKNDDNDKDVIELLDDDSDEDSQNSDSSEEKREDNNRSKEEETKTAFQDQDEDKDGKHHDGSNEDAQDSDSSEEKEDDNNSSYEEETKTDFQDQDEDKDGKHHDDPNEDPQDSDSGEENQEDDSSSKEEETKTDFQDQDKDEDGKQNTTSRIVTPNISDPPKTESKSSSCEHLTSLDDIDRNSKQGNGSSSSNLQQEITLGSVYQNDKSSKRSLEDLQIFIRQPRDTHNLITLDDDSVSTSNSAINGAANAATLNRAHEQKRKKCSHPEPTPVDAHFGTLKRSTGRSREWLNNNLDFDACNFSAKFSVGSFGTRTKKGICTIEWLILNDEWNNLVESQLEEQLFYVGTGRNREKFADAFVRQASAVPLFHAPKKAERTKKIYYVGHWIPVVHTCRTFIDPIKVFGRERQKLIRLKFDHFDEDLSRQMDKTDMDAFGDSKRDTVNTTQSNNNYNGTINARQNYISRTTIHMPTNQQYSDVRGDDAATVSPHVSPIVYGTQSVYSRPTFRAILPTYFPTI